MLNSGHRQCVDSHIGAERNADDLINQVIIVTKLLPMKGFLPKFSHFAVSCFCAAFPRVRNNICVHTLATRYIPSCLHFIRAWYKYPAMKMFVKGVRSVTVDKCGNELKTFVRSAIKCPHGFGLIYVTVYQRLFISWFVKFLYPFSSGCNYWHCNIGVVKLFWSADY